MTPTPPSPVTHERWYAAQDAEHGYWYPASALQRATRRVEEHARLHWIAGLLGIRAATVVGRSVMDLAGGPQPLVSWPSLPLQRRVLVDPLVLDASDVLALGHVERYPEPAEDFALEAKVDEVWAYNALQHVRDPSAVMATARRHATRAIRWFEWIDQPVTEVHPHAIAADWMCAQLGSYRRTAWTVGVRDEGQGWMQRFCAGVWECTQ